MIDGYRHWTEHERDSPASPGIKAAAKQQQGWAILDIAEERCWLTYSQYAAAIAQAGRHSPTLVINGIDVTPPTLAQDLVPSDMEVPDPLFREMWAIRATQPAQRLQRLLSAWRRTGFRALLTEGAEAARIKPGELAHHLAAQQLSDFPLLDRSMLFGTTWRELETRTHILVGPGTLLARLIVKVLRARRYVFLHPAWSWEIAYAEHRMWIWHAFYEACKPLGGVSIHGLRVARRESPHHVRRYRKAQRADEKANRPRFDAEIAIDGVQYLIGFAIEAKSE